MRKAIKNLTLFLSLLLGCISLISQKSYAQNLLIDEKTFPDQYFREYIANRYDKDTNGLLDEEEIKSVKSIWFNSEGACNSLEGIQYFPNIEQLRITNGKSDMVDVSGKDKLIWVSMENFQVREFDFSGCERFRDCYIHRSGMEKIDLSGCIALKELNIFDTNLEELNIDDSKQLRRFICEKSNISQIHLDHPRISYLGLSYNAIEKIDLSGVPDLVRCELIGNQLAELDASNNPILSIMCCDKNNLTTLDCSNLKYFQDLSCVGNELEELNIAGCEQLVFLQCQNNHLKALDFSDSKVLKYGEYVETSPQTVQFETNPDGNVDFRQIHGVDPEQIQSFEGGQFIDGIFYPDPGNEEFVYYYNAPVRQMRVEFTLIPHQHKIVKVPGREPSCVDGNKEYYVCEKCKKMYTDETASEEITDLTEITLEKTGEHSYDIGHIIEKPTCQNQGIKEYKCVHCGDIKTESLDRVSHKYQLLVSKATLKKDGKIEETCEFCKRVKKTTLIRAVSKITLSKKVFTYDGKVKKPQVILKDNKGNAILHGFYVADFPGKSIKVGEYTVKIRLKGLYSGKKNVTFSILPKPTKITSIVPAKKSIKLKWNKQMKQTQGYEIQYSTSSKYAKKDTKTIKITSSKIVSRIIKNLESNKRYYVRIRTFKMVNGKRFTSLWSNSKTVFTK